VGGALDGVDEVALERVRAVADRGDAIAVPAEYLEIVAVRR